MPKISRYFCNSYDYAQGAPIFFGKRESAFLIPGNINGINILQNATRAVFLIFSNP